MAYELGVFFGINTDPIMILVCLLIGRSQKTYLKVIIYTIAYVFVVRILFIYLGTYENLIDKIQIYHLIGGIIYSSIFFASKSFKFKKDKYTNS